MEHDTRAELLRTAEEMARTRGYDGFSFADLADRVGIRKASVHYHFPTKASLSEALVEQYHARISDDCASISRRCKTAADKLRAIISLYKDSAGDGERLCLCVSLTASQHSLPASVSDRIDAYRKMVVSWLEKVFIEALRDDTVDGVTAPAVEAPALLALLEGAQLAARPLQRITPFEDATALFRQRLN